MSKLSVVACIATCLFSSTAYADMITMYNNTDMEIVRLECYQDGSIEPQSLVLENLAPFSSVEFSPENTPEFFCQRLVYTLDSNGEEQVIQFYAEHTVPSLETIQLDFNPVNAYSTEHLMPQLTSTNGYYVEQKAPGITFNLATQFLVGEESEARWQTYTTPGEHINDNSDYFLTAGGQSWSLTGQKVEFRGDKPYAFGVYTVYTPSLATPLFAELDNYGFKLETLMFDGIETPFNGDGINAMNNALLLTLAFNGDNRTMYFTNENGLSLILNFSQGLVHMSLSNPNIEF